MGRASSQSVSLHKSPLVTLSFNFPLQHNQSQTEWLARLWDYGRQLFHHISKCVFRCPGYPPNQQHHCTDFLPTSCSHVSCDVESMLVPSPWRWLEAVMLFMLSSSHLLSPLPKGFQALASQGQVVYGLWEERTGLRHGQGATQRIQVIPSISFNSRATSLRESARSVISMILLQQSCQTGERRKYSETCDMRVGVDLFCTIITLAWT